MASPMPIQHAGKTSLIAKIAGRFGVDPEKMLPTLKATAFKGDVSNEQMMMLLIVADQYNLNPWTKEIYAFPDKGGIVPVVGVDGWLRIINGHPEFDGLEFSEAETDGAPPAWIECTIYRKDRSHPTKAREYFSETKRDTGPWKSHPRRMLRHKALIQCARLAFGYVGIYDEDEARRTIDVEHESGGRNSSVESVKERLKERAGVTLDGKAEAHTEPIEAAAGPGSMPYAEVAATLAHAHGLKDLDKLNDAATLIERVEGPLLREELTMLFKRYRDEVAG